MSCLVTAPNGANNKCTNYLQKAIAAIITDPSFSWASVGAVDNIENIRVLLQETRKGFIVEFNGTTPTAGEAVSETTGFGQNFTTGVNAGSLLGYVKSNPCDFKEVLSAFKGGTYNVALFLEDGSILVVDNLQSKEPALKGFEAQVYALDIGIPGQENQSQGYRLQINFFKAEEFRSFKVVDVHYSFNDLLDLLPLGLSAEVSTPWDGSDIVLSVATRCVGDSPKSGALTVEIEKATQGLVVSGTATDNGDGTYTVTIQKDGPADLAAGEYARFFLVSKTGDVYDEISNVIEVEN